MGEEANPWRSDAAMVAARVRQKAETMQGLGSVDWVYLDAAAPGGVHVGDLVSAAAGGLPTYRVVALEGPKVRLKDEVRGADQVMPLSALHWKACRAPARD